MDSGTALLHLFFLSAMILILVGGLVAVLVLWYVRGRDPHTGAIATYRSDPPDDLPPGAAGTLLDEHAEHHDVVATMLGLARHGAVEITEARQGRALGFNLTLLHPDRIESRLEHDLLVVLFGPNAQPMQEVRLSDIRGAFKEAEPRIRHDLYQEMVDRRYFRRAPDVTRRRWRRLSWVGIVGSVIVGIVLAILTDFWALLPTIAAVIMWAVMLRVAKGMPKKTRHGAEAAAQWRAFRAYLEDIRKHENLETATELFDRYLAYAVAFRLEKQWVKDFQRAGTPVPRWYHSAGDIFALHGVGDGVWDAMQAGHMVGHIGGGLDAGDVNVPDMPDVGGMPNIDMPGAGDGLQGASNAMTGGLAGASEGMFDLLDSAGSAFDAIDFDI